MSIKRSRVVGVKGRNFSQDENQPLSKMWPAEMQSTINFPEEFNVYHCTGQVIVIKIYD